jgi:hypothetical protein
MRRTPIATLCALLVVLACGAGWWTVDDRPVTAQPYSVGTP